MIIQRLCFFIAKVAIWLAGLACGFSVVFLVAEHIAPSKPTLIQSVGMCVLAVSGPVFGVLGAHFAFALPLHFVFPNARKLFSWESRDPPIVFRYYRWYGEKLKEYGVLRETGET